MNALIGDMNAAHLAQEYVRLHGGNYDLMIGWFSKAIMTGSLKGRQEFREEAIRLTYSQLGLVMAVLQDPGQKQLASDIKEIVVEMLKTIPAEPEGE